MKKCVNGQYLEMTPEEIAALEQAATQQPAPEQTSEKRIAALEKERRETKRLLGLEDTV